LKVNVDFSSFALPSQYFSNRSTFSSTPGSKEEILNGPVPIGFLSISFSSTSTIAVFGCTSSEGNCGNTSSV